MQGLNIADFDDLKKYFEELYRWNPEGAHDSSCEIRGELGTQMKKLFYMSLDCQGLDDCLDRIRRVRQSPLSLDDWKEQYKKYLLLMAQRQEFIERKNRTRRWYQSGLENIEPLNEHNWNIWGSIRQIKFGRVVIETLEYDLDPIFGALLSPTGGIVGAGNNALYDGEHDDGVVLHGIVHDAGGYLYNYHKIGPGYNYLRTRWTLFSTANPLSTQAAGIAFWEKMIVEIESRPVLIPEVEPEVEEPEESENEDIYGGAMDVTAGENDALVEKNKEEIFAVADEYM